MQFYCDREENPNKYLPNYLECIPQLLSLLNPIKKYIKKMVVHQDYQCSPYGPFKKYFLLASRKKKKNKYIKNRTEVQSNPRNRAVPWRK